MRFPVLPSPALVFGLRDSRPPAMVDEGALSLPFEFHRFVVYSVWLRTKERSGSLRDVYLPSQRGLLHSRPSTDLQRISEGNLFFFSLFTALAVKCLGLRDERRREQSTRDRV